jgi:hypothetical protein
VAAAAPCEVVIVCPHGWHGTVGNDGRRARMLETLPDLRACEAEQGVSFAGACVAV